MLPGGQIFIRSDTAIQRWYNWDQTIIIRDVLLFTENNNLF